MRFNCRHGDMLFLAFDNTKTTLAPPASAHEMMDTSSRPSSSGSTASMQSARASVSGNQMVLVNNQSVKEDDVDQRLSKMDGRIERKRNDQLCRHGPQGKCFHCVPLEPYDEKYLQSLDPPIKFLSFHSHIRKLTGGVDK